MLYNFSQIRGKIQNYLGMTTLDSSSMPTLDFVNQAINDSIREPLSEFNYKQLETSTRYPFSHSIFNVQGAFLTGTSIAPSPVGSGITANVVPYPSDNLLINSQVNINYSGIPFLGTDSNGVIYTGVSNAGNIIYGTMNNVVGYQYELNPDIEQIYAITIPLNSLKLAFMPQYDFDRSVPQGLTISSGTPSMYTTFPGLSSSGNIIVQFYPEPVYATYSGQTFVVHYKRKHQDLVNDTDTQRVIPEQFQDIIIDSTLEKSYIFLSDEKALYHKQRKIERTIDMKIWAENNLDYVNIARDGNFLSTPNLSAYNTTIQFRL